MYGFVLIAFASVVSTGVYVFVLITFESVGLRGVAASEFVVWLN